MVPSDMNHLSVKDKASQSHIDTFVQIYSQKLEENLRHNIISFWMPGTLDAVNGGYTINADLHGKSLGPGVKMIVSQARQVWLFSKLAQQDNEGREFLAAADLGYRFLREKMWDRLHGGFFWQVDASGTEVLISEKHLYGQAFGLYAICEYYRACRKAEVLTFCSELFGLMDTKAHDGTYGGYIETFTEDWRRSPLRYSVMGEHPDVKLINTHLHLLEAVTEFYKISQAPLAHDRLLELIKIMQTKAVGNNAMPGPEKYRPNWNPLGRYYINSRISYGHALEMIWLLVAASDAAGENPASLMDLQKRLFDYAYRHGFDKRKGGFYYSGVLIKNRNKIWWVQAEALVCTLYLYRLTRERKYLEIFARTYDFIERYVVDWENGEWHAAITPRGEPRGDKAGPWKAGYHNGRAMIECLSILKEISQGEP